ncbi:NAD-dependent epimerase/dehydratase family protein [Phycicoccus sp. MAQZ13P-2]|uniref:polysaccharide biosynthesis C-terminal domain-containing protein n=1 Tax=Phycicoccus mangrovi TaxID=2840470 RepID=UPI001BFFE937|nr:NAD-dependent epimerase/dehydratase family protein [Phycicoccus mangrovi]MBT9257617.1 NAD-dependent epimerase/dehydratase family protein [Phycicoccus mangrovi]MBT9276056.1 NAD-dependent epimerase/dehydratase family protein [Phycicoccus mangrovi]
MKVVLTGAAGFLGWHTRLRAHALGEHDVVPVSRKTWSDLPSLVAGADAVIHVAGVNRGTDEEVEQGNIDLANDVASAVRAVNRPVRVVYANSIQDGNGTPYGTGKATAGSTLSSLRAQGHSVVDVRLPNIFGEHGRPRYNSFVATFVHAVAAGESPEVTDRPVELLHVQDAAQAMLDGLTTDSERLDPRGTRVGVQEVLDLLHEFEASYSTGEFPDLSTPFRIALFNTYRAAIFPQRYPITLTPHADARGTFVETVRSRGGEGQSSISTTVPGITRGEHYHLSKIERFAVVQGTATIALRRMFHDEVVEFAVSGDAPCAVDMPVGWAHNITNTGDDVLLTQFWSHELFRPDAPDTFPHPVIQEAGA